MEKVITTISKELNNGYRHGFVLTQNIKDTIEIGTSSFNFSSALARCLTNTMKTENQSSTSMVYTLSGGIKLYQNGEIITDSSDARVSNFHGLTGLGGMLRLAATNTAELTQKLRDAGDVLPLLYPMMLQERSYLIIDNTEYITDCSGQGISGLSNRIIIDTLKNWSIDNNIRSKKSGFILLYSEIGHVNKELIEGDDGLMLIPVHYPNHTDRLEYLKAINQHNKTDDELNKMANMMTGFRRVEIREAYEQNYKDNDIARKKGEIILSRCGDMIEFIKSDFGLEKANAQPHVKKYLQDLKTAMLEDRKKSPRGILFVGVPGNGKSHICKAFAHDCGMNMLRFKNLRSSWYGESESRLETILDILPSLAPCIIFIDEVDQMLSSRSNSSHNSASDCGQTDARILGRLLDFMADNSHRGEILWIGATNRPDLMDIASIRRFDRVFPFMNPDKNVRKVLIDEIASNSNIPLDSSFNREDAANKCVNMSCDEIEKVLNKAYEKASFSNKVNISIDDFNYAITNYKHNYDPVMYELIALLSIRAANYWDDLPWFTCDGIIQGEFELPDYLEPIRKLSGKKENIIEYLEKREASLRGELLSR